MNQNPASYGIPRESEFRAVGIKRSETAIRHRFYKLGIPLKGKSLEGVKNYENNFANHHERQFMEYLRGMVWIKEKMLPPTDRLSTVLLSKGWIEKRSQDNQTFYRMTELGLAAFKAPVPIQKSWSKPVG